MKKARTLASENVQSKVEVKKSGKAFAVLEKEYFFTAEAVIYIDSS